MANGKDLVFGMLALLLFSGCEAGWDGSTGHEGTRAAASSSYLVFFGPAPVTSADAYLAMVGFLPRIKDPGKVSPFPLFVPPSPHNMESLARRIIGFAPSLCHPLGLYNPFPAGTSLRALIQKQDVVYVDLTRQAGRKTDLPGRKAMVAVLGHTLMQFPGVKRVVVSSEGIPLLGPKALFYIPNVQDIIGPEGPELVAVGRNWDRIHPENRSISLYFDRPIQLRDLHLADDDGRAIAGNLRPGEFDMSMVMVPTSPDVMRENMRLTVRWNVVDRLGQRGSGEQLFHLDQDPHH